MKSRLSSQAGQPRNPYPTVDVVIHDPLRGVVLVARRNPPRGWALPGGFIDYGETVEQAAVREAREETGLAVRLERLLGVYSSPGRDPRHHAMSVVFVAAPSGGGSLPEGGDDAAKARFFPLGQWPDLVFDHAGILDDFCGMLAGVESTVSTGATTCGWHQKDM